MNISLTKEITFIKISTEYQKTVFQWLDEPHVKEFWDNSQEHRDDIINFIEGRKIPSPYFDGIFTYWLGKFDDEPYCLLMTSEWQDSVDQPELHRKYLSKLGKTLSIDFCIGNKKYLGKGLAALTLQKFTECIKNKVDPEVDTFFIDPDTSNPRAIHVYEKAGFKTLGKFNVDEGYFVGNSSLLMIKKIL